MIPASDPKQPLIITVCIVQCVMFNACSDQALRKNRDLCKLVWMGHVSCSMHVRTRPCSRCPSDDDGDDDDDDDDGDDAPMFNACSDQALRKNRDLCKLESMGHLSCSMHVRTRPYSRCPSDDDGDDDDDDDDAQYA